MYRTYPEITAHKTVDDWIDCKGMGLSISLLFVMKYFCLLTEILEERHITYQRNGRSISSGRQRIEPYMSPYPG